MLYEALKEDSGIDLGENGYQFMKELLDQIYGVEQAIIDRADLNNKWRNKVKPKRDGIEKKFNDEEILDTKAFFARINEAKEKNKSLK